MGRVINHKERKEHKERGWGAPYRRMRMSDILKVCDQVREIAYAIHVYHGNGYLEKVYELSLIHI